MASGFVGLGVASSVISAAPAGAVGSGATNFTPSYTVPAGTEVISLGAIGGGGGWNGSGQTGRGTQSSGCALGQTMVVTPGDTFTAVVGRGGGYYPFGDAGTSGGAGWTRGGNGGAGGDYNFSSQSNGGDGAGGGGGGGSTAILKSGTPIMVAGGGGGMSGNWDAGGDGCFDGSLNGDDGDSNISSTLPGGGHGTTGGQGGYGTDASGGAGGDYPNGNGGDGGNGGSYNWGGGGGGGGWAGGGGGGGDWHSGGGGAAGSSYATGSTAGYPALSASKAWNSGGNGNATVSSIDITGVSVTSGTAGTAYSGQITGYAGSRYLDGVSVCAGVTDPPWNPGNCVKRNGGTLGTANLLAQGFTKLSISVSPKLPAGLSLNAQTGAITGTPSWGSNATYAVTATLVGSSDSSKVYARSTGSFSLAITGDPAPFTCNSAIAAGLVMGQLYINPSGDLTTWSQGGWHMTKLKNLGINTTTATAYAVVQKYSRVSLWRMTVASGTLSTPDSIGDISGLPSGVRLIGGDVDSSTGTYYLSSKTRVFAVDTSTRVATELTTVPSGWVLGRDIAVFGGSVWTVTPRKLEGFNISTGASTAVSLPKSMRGPSATIVQIGDDNSLAWIRNTSGTIFQATHLTDGAAVTFSNVGSGPVSPPDRVGDGAGGCLSFG